MIVVADTSPLNYLVLIDAIDVLPSLFGEVYAPPEVIRELADLLAPTRSGRSRRDIANGENGPSQPSL